MKEKRFSLCNLGRNIIVLGKQGEANHLRIEFDCSSWLDEYPNSIVVLYHFPAGKKSSYKPKLEKVGTNRVWTVCAEDTVYAGDGVIELVLEDAETSAVLKSATGHTNVLYSPSAAQPSADDGNVDNGSGGEGENSGFCYKIGNGLKIVGGDTLSVDTAAVVERDNTKPVTSGAVYTEVGNINALLSTI